MMVCSGLKYSAWLPVLTIDSMVWRTLGLSLPGAALLFAPGSWLTLLLDKAALPPLAPGPDDPVAGGSIRLVTTGPFAALLAICVAARDSRLGRNAPLGDPDGKPLIE
mmetsp:Transcript_145825/g.254421  ORF Transcript_145825/g.254421 Transcript_145825/m.254421 type:complete len:108 (+) Transcript_145825:538-861(+)